MSDKNESLPPPPAYGEPSGVTTHNAQQYYSQPTSYGPTTPIHQEPQYTRPPMNNMYMSPCAQGHHNPSIRFGLCGILAAIFFFPIGFICMCLDTERVCSRCGIRM